MGSAPVTRRFATREDPYHPLTIRDAEKWTPDLRVLIHMVTGYTVSPTGVTAMPPDHECLALYLDNDRRRDKFIRHLPKASAAYYIQWFCLGQQTFTDLDGLVHELDEEGRYLYEVVTSNLFTYISYIHIYIHI